MTEDEARQKWCPMARLTVLNKALPDVATPSFNRAAGSDADGKAVDLFDSNLTCIASDCMAWRATDSEYEPELSHEGTAVRVPQEDKPAGYCGLAGEDML